MIILKSFPVSTHFRNSFNYYRQSCREPVESGVVKKKKKKKRHYSAPSALQEKYEGFSAQK